MLQLIVGRVFLICRRLLFVAVKVWLIEWLCGWLSTAFSRSGSCATLRSAFVVVSHIRTLDWPIVSSVIILHLDSESFFEP